MGTRTRLPASILGGDPFNQFRFLYRRELLWKLFDEEYCYRVMKTCHEAGGMGYDLSFVENTRLFRRLLDETGEDLVGFGNPTWEQGFFLNERYLMHSRDRILRTLVERIWPAQIAHKVEENLSKDAVLVFGYDRQADLMSDKEIAAIHLDMDAYLKRLSIFKDCRYILMGGSDADYLVSLGRMDLVKELVFVTRQAGYIPFLLCQYPSIVLPKAEEAGLEVEGYAVPLNKEWSWLDRDSCLAAVKATQKPVIAFMPLASGDLRKDVRGALDWLYCDAGVESILYGTATAEHARSTTLVANEARQAADKRRNT